jgi:ribonucleoside-diphosphate reductase beta chain
VSVDNSPATAVRDAAAAPTRPPGIAGLEAAALTATRPGKLRDYKVVGGLDTFANRSFWPNFFSRLVARMQWNPAAIDLAPDARMWPKLPAERRGRLMTLLAGFCVAEDAVAEQLTPFADAAREATLPSQESLMAWVFFLQRRDEQRHARLFDRIGAEVLGLPGATAAERRAAARAHVPAAFLELFEERLPAMAAELAAGRTGLSEGVSLYHMLLEGVVFDAGQHALLDDLADGALPGVREGVERVERDERWHVGFGLRCLIETQPSADVLDDLLQRAGEAAAAWGDAVPAGTREHSARKVAHRLHAAGLIETRAA